jgi:hypothetical protein
VSLLIIRDDKSLSCHKSAGRLSRHHAVNDLIKRALASAEVPARLEPSTLARDDSKRSDGLTLAPRKEGRCLVWDFTCPDTLALSYLNKAVTGAATVQTWQRMKMCKYTSMSTTYYFVPAAVETLGPLGYDAVLSFS